MVPSDLSHPLTYLTGPPHAMDFGPVSLILTVFAIPTSVRCLSTWQFVNIAVCKVVLSTFLGCSTMTTALSVRPTATLETNGIREAHEDTIDLPPLNRNQHQAPPERIWASSLKIVTQSGCSCLWGGLIIGLVGLFSEEIKVAKSHLYHVGSARSNSRFVRSVVCVFRGGQP